MFEEYRTLRDSGYTKEEAAEFFIKKAPMIILSNKADDYIGKNNKVDGNLNVKTLSASGWSDKRNKLDKIKRSDIIETESGFTCFPDELQNESVILTKEK
jgi:hypothetical protein